VFQNPVLTTTRIAETLDTTLQSALKHVRRLESAGIVSEAQGVPGRSKRWISTEVFHALDPEASATFPTTTRRCPTTPVPPALVDPGPA